MGFAGNEKADEYAKEATRKPDIDIAIQYNTLVVKNIMKKEILAEWQHRWDDSSKAEKSSPSYHRDSDIQLLLFNTKSKQGLKEIMEQKLQLALQPTEDNDN
ncbi:hypothetical protein CDAR_57181 [Caerostris darwini]|uniref:RNase H type-1 domain-containing protein n=1 Tax=Caerostris darwini TaxID=1538125 RepID=A0AAV4WDE5_9ARAC|nr:hypothetical protein CDAR_57181 [Caerostris darwini]